MKTRDVLSYLPLLALFSMGCAPALSGMQPAHVAPKGHVQAEFGMDVSIPTGTISDAVDAVDNLVKASQDHNLSQQEINEVYRTAGAFVLNPPSATPHIGVGYTPVDNVEISLRYATSQLRLGGRYQFLNKEKHNVDATVGLGFGYYVLEFPLADKIPIVKLEDFSRFQLDVPLLFGTHGNWYRVWGGPRFMYTHFGTELKLDIPGSSLVTPYSELASFSGNGFYVGAQGGVAVGYKYVFLAFEFTFVRLFMNGNLDVLQKPLVNVDLTSNIVYPTIGLIGEF